MSGGLLSEHAVKLEMIRSIARSQAALAAILESIAEITGQSELTARKLSDNIRILSQYQSAMCRMMSGISLHQPKQGSLRHHGLTSMRKGRREEHMEYRRSRSMKRKKAIKRSGRAAKRRTLLVTRKAKIRRGAGRKLRKLRSGKTKRGLLLRKKEDSAAG